MSPEWKEVLQYFGTGLGFLLSGFGGAFFHKKRNSGWDEARDHDRRILPHIHGDNGKPKLVPQSECDLRHELVKEMLDNIIEGNTEIKRDVRSINQQLRGS